MFSRLTRKKTSLISLSITAALAFAAYFLFFYSITGKNDEAAALGQKIALAGEREAAAQSLKGLLSNTEAERSEFSAYFVDDNSIVTFIEQVEGLGRAAGIEVSLSSVATDESRPHVLITGVSVKGSFEGIYYFLLLLESLPYEIDVVRFSLGALPAPLQRGFSWEGEAGVELLNFIPSS